MSFMLSQIYDHDGGRLIASCPLYHDTPLCVNSCAMFIPLREVIEGEDFTDYRYGYCGLVGDKGQLLEAVSQEDEERMRESRSYKRRL